jgi:hypothetical protein
MSSASAVRDTILITHANPEDNHFARWLAARLSTAGYRAWVDLRALRAILIVGNSLDAARQSG